MRISGTWQGQYTYGAGYEGIAGVGGSSVPFTMSITESWLGKVTGYVRDDATKGGMPERGHIVGKRSRQSLEFVKVMPNNYVFDVEGRLVDLRQAMQAQHGIELPAELPPHRIFYSGTLSDDGQSASGDWLIMPWPGEDQAETFGQGLGNGTWTARRVSDQPSAV